MLVVVIGFLLVSTLLYILLGGADFGAGILELFTSPRHRARTRKLSYYSIGPVWEANHMWLVIVIVILFVAFPEIYTTVTTYLHIPLLIMLFGIICRGTSFIFRNYDAIRDRKSQLIYSHIFEYSSCITPLFLGIIASTMISGRIAPEAQNFQGLYIQSWWNLFSVTTGLFTVTIFGFLAAVYLVGEAKDTADRKRYTSKAITTSLLSILFGILVFLSAGIEKITLFRRLLINPLSLSAIILSFLSLIFLWYSLFRGRTRILRVLAAFQVTLILVAVYYGVFPDLVIFNNGHSLTLLNNTAPTLTIRALGIALISGSIFILPFLVYLFYNFQFREETLD